MVTRLVFVLITMLPNFRSLCTTFLCGIYDGDDNDDDKGDDVFQQEDDEDFSNIGSCNVS